MLPLTQRAIDLSSCTIWPFLGVFILKLFSRVFSRAFSHVQLIRVCVRVPQTLWPRIKVRHKTPGYSPWTTAFAISSNVLLSYTKPTSRANDCRPTIVGGRCLVHSSVVQYLELNDIPKLIPKDKWVVWWRGAFEYCGRHLFSLSSKSFFSTVHF